MGVLNGASTFDAYLLAHSILADARKGAGFSQLAIADGTTSLGLALVELGVKTGVRVIAGVHDAEQEASLAALGADHVIRRDSLDFIDEVMRQTDGLGIELIVDQVAGPDFERNFDMLADFGDILVTDWTAGDPPHLFETMWAKLDRCPSIQLWTLDRYRSRPERMQELQREVRDCLGSSHSEIEA